MLQCQRAGLLAGLSVQCRHSRVGISIQTGCFAARWIWERLLAHNRTRFHHDTKTAHLSASSPRRRSDGCGERGHADIVHDNPLFSGQRGITTLLRVVSGQVGRRSMRVLPVNSASHHENHAHQGWWMCHRLYRSLKQSVLNQVSR